MGVTQLPSSSILIGTFLFNRSCSIKCYRTVDKRVSWWKSELEATFSQLLNNSTGSFELKLKKALAIFSFMLAELLLLLLLLLSTATYF